MFFFPGKANRRNTFTRDREVLAVKLLNTLLCIKAYMVSVCLNKEGDVKRHLYRKLYLVRSVAYSFLFVGRA